MSAKRLAARPIMVMVALLGVLLSFGFIPPVHADTFELSDQITITIEIPSEDEGVTNSLSQGTASEPTFFNGGSVSTSNGVKLNMIFDVPVFIESVEFEHTFSKYKYICSTGYTQVPESLYAGTSLGENNVYDERDFNPDCATINTWHTRTVDMLGRVGGLPTDASGVTRYWQLLAVVASSYSVPTRNSDIRNVEITYREAIITTSGDLVRPLQQPDESDWGVYEYEETHKVIAWSNEPEQLVFSAEAGLVTSVTEIEDNAACYFSSGTLLSCQVDVPDSVTGNGDYIYTFYNDPKPYEVIIEGGTYTWLYIVRDADKYITQGAYVQAGCVLGKTIKLKGYGFSFGGGIQIGAIPSERGVTLVEADDGVEDVIDFLSIYPSSTQACNVDPGYSDCYGDSALEHPEDWNATGDVVWTDPGVQIAPGASIVQQLNLNANQQPQMRVNARNLGGVAEMTLRIGETEESFELSSGQYEDYQIDGAEHQPSSGIFYDIVIQNDSDTATLDVKYVCVSFTLDNEGNPEPDPQPSQCYFDNYSFDGGSASWTVSGGVSSGEGEVHVPDGETVAQTLHLYPADGRVETYRITVVAGLRYYVAYTPDETETTAQAELEFLYPAGGSYDSMGAKTFGEFALNRNQVTFVDTFSIAAETDSTFTLRAQLISPPGEVVGIAIRSACITVDDGSPFPGYDEDDEQPEPELFPESCEVISPPSGNDVGSWISWQWSKFNRFHQCDLMVFLNDQYRTIRKFFTTVGWAIRYGHTTFQMTLDWFEQALLPWLGGYFTNMSGNVTVNYSGSQDSSCEWYNIFCHATKALSIGSDLFGKLFDVIGLAIKDVIAPLTEFLIRVLGGAFDLLFNLVNSLLSLFFAFLAKIFESMDFARILLLSILDGYNTATPTPIPGLPDCTGDPGQNIFCLLIWTGDNTILEGSRGELIIPLLTAVLGILLAIHFVREIKQLLIGAMNSV